MCGSPGHLRRDCPAVSSPHPMIQRGQCWIFYCHYFLFFTMQGSLFCLYFIGIIGNAMFPGAMPGYVSPYWNGPPFPHLRQFVNPYGHYGMMPYNATVIPTAPFPVPTYIPSMFGLSPAFG